MAGWRSPVESFRLVRSLGFSQVLRVVVYRAGLAMGIHPVQRIRASPPSGPFFPDFLHPEKMPSNPGRELISKSFGWRDMSLAGSPPDWFQYLDPEQGATARTLPWWDLPDFLGSGQDIKETWELSRFDWVPLGALGICEGDERARDTLEHWMEDWVRANPPYLGPNWKCGQEASIRLLHLGMAALMGGGLQLSKGMKELVRIHLARISPTVAYALGQDNNHATSEGAGLFIGGSWLLASGDPTGRRWMEQGRKLLERSVARLFEEDGSFSQQSVVYHRLALDTLSFVEVWRAKFDLPPFSSLYITRAKAATSWLDNMLVPEAKGDVPNLGANDGANLFAFLGGEYRDFRPSVELASRVFHGESVYPAHPDAQRLTHLFEVKPPRRKIQESGSSIPVYKVMEKGGYGVITLGRVFAMLRFPRARFRPGHSDALHLDLWIGGQNLFRDGGSYSYAADLALQDRLVGPEGHSSVQFDGRDPMPRVGRFLRKDWMDTHYLHWGSNDEKDSWIEAEVNDQKGGRHRRKVIVTSDVVQVEDTVSGFQESAVLRWRLRPGAWRIEDDGLLTDGEISVVIHSTSSIRRLELKDGLESRYYLQLTSLPVIEVEIPTPGILTTKVSWS